jgi:hypothetical protein
VEQLRGLGRLTFGQIRGAQKRIGPKHSRLPGHELLQVLDGRLHCAALDIELGQRKHSVSEVRGNRSRFLQFRLGLLEAACLELRQPEMVVSHGIPGVELEHLLEFLDGLMWSRAWPGARAPAEDAPQDPMGSS